MADDPTEAIRREQQAAINAFPGSREALEAEYGKDNVFDTAQLRELFEVQGFAAPYVVVRRKADNVRGSLMFQHHPRFYWGFEPAQ